MLISRSRVLSALAIVCASSLLAACGGGGGGGSGSGGGSTGGGGSGNSLLTWVSGAFAASGQYANKCATVRTGVDIEGNPFPDQAGSILQENFWLRSWTHETYLWNGEVVDRNPANYADPVAYFNTLKTTATTSSGRAKDQFHFSENTADYLAAVNSAPLATYGANYVAYSVSPPRDFRVAYTEPNSPASNIVGGQANLPRGTRILAVDGVDLVNGGSTQAQIDILNNGLFPATAGETHTFVVQDAGASSSRSVTLTSVNLAEKPVNRTAIVHTPGGDVGYILFTTFSPFSSEQEIAAAISAMKTASVSDLVLDLRYNGGGLLAVASQLGYMIAGGARTTGRTFERLQFNSAAGNLDPVTGEVNSPVPFYSTGLGFSLAQGAPLDSLNLPRVFVLTTGSTCSASESVINSLRGVGVDVVQIGSTTCGKPYGFYPQDNCGETYFTIQFQGVNDIGFGDYADGFTPNNSSSNFGVRINGCAVADDLSHELGDQNEGLLATALQYRASGSCPVATAAAAVAQTRTPSEGPLRTSRFTPLQQFLRGNRDMRMPH